jgi:hypothetical protein
MRAWVVDFARRLCDDDCFVAFTDAFSRENLAPLGAFDHTADVGAWRNPKQSYSPNELPEVFVSPEHAEWVAWLAAPAGAEPPFGARPCAPSHVAAPPRAPLDRRRRRRHDPRGAGPRRAARRVLRRRRELQVHAGARGRQPLVSPARLARQGRALWEVPSRPVRAVAPPPDRRAHRSATRRSNRFYEAVMCCSLPILHRREHAGRTDDELRHPFFYYIYDASHASEHYVYHRDWATANLHTFLRLHTLINVADFEHLECPP